MTQPAQDLMALMPFAAMIGLEIDGASKDEVVGRIRWAPQRCTAGNALLGGLLMSLADSLGGVCAYLNLPPGAATSTTSSSTVFVRGVTSGQVTGTARPLHVGRSTIAVTTELRDDQGRLVAQVTQSQAVLVPK